MQSSVQIYKTVGDAPYAAYRCNASGKFGGGYQGAAAGATVEAAAAFAAREQWRYIRTNPEGGQLIAPPEVLAAMRD